LAEVTAPEESLRARKKRAARARILAAADALIRSQGYEQTTMRHIASSAEVSYQTLYNYFPAKGDILLQLLIDRIEDVSAHYAEVLRSFDGDLLEALDELARLACTALTSDDRALWQTALIALLSQDSGASKLLDLIDAVAHQSLEALLSAARTSGELTPSVPVAELANTLYDLMDYAVVRLLLDPNADVQTTLRNLSARFSVVLSPQLTRHRQ
jgi:AcrR family transcriptional regulator